jgi:hypothetical protein
MLSGAATNYTSADTKTDAFILPGPPLPRMDASRSLRWAVYYVVLAGIATLLGGALVGGGVLSGIADGYGQLADGAALTTALKTAAPGLALAVVGVVVWAIGTVTAFVRVFTAAVEEQMRERFDSEKVKSEILSALDERLSEVEHDVSETRRQVSELKRDESAEEFQFGEQ